MVPLSLPSWECGLKSLSGTRTLTAWRHSLRGSVDWNVLGSFRRVTIRRHSLRGSVDWNEFWQLIDYLLFRHSLRGSVDWNHILPSSSTLHNVTPFVGVWIEIGYKKKIHKNGNRHSLRGSVDWNFFTLKSWSPLNGHSLRGSVDWNFALFCQCFFQLLSLPSWECGLKSERKLWKWFSTWSLPSWECGLKLRYLGVIC